MDVKKIFVSQWCDYPGCADAAIEKGIDITKGQATQTLKSWFYPTPGRGRKPKPLTNDLCEEHMQKVLAIRDELRVNGELSTEQVEE